MQKLIWMLIMIFLFSIKSNSKTDELGDVVFVNCLKNICIELKSAEMKIRPPLPITAFGSATLTKYSQSSKGQTKVITSWDGDNGYIDGKLNRIILRKKHTTHRTELIYFINTGEFLEI